MTKQFIILLKQKLTSLVREGLSDAEILRNSAKEEIQYYVLDFIYHHPKYSQWTMYGGSALRICHGLNRMSVDLDFEIKKSCTKSFLNGFKKDVEKYFFENYELNASQLAIKVINRRGLLLKFIIGEELGIDHHSKQVYVKIDLNQFIAAKAITERMPVNHDQLAFVIKTYNMGTLMASKIAAILLRGTRGIGSNIYEEKGRDIYDLLWYMEKKIIPDMDYLIAKNIAVHDLRTLFDRLTIRMNKVNKENLQQDLSPLFFDQNYIQNWLNQWFESYMSLLKLYEIHTVTKLREIYVRQDNNSDNYRFVYKYDTEEGEIVRITYVVSDYWFKFSEGAIPTEIDNKIVDLIRTEGGKKGSKLDNRINQFATLFNKKNSQYLKKINNVILGNSIKTKIICMTVGSQTLKGKIFFNRSALISCGVEDFLE